MGNVSNPAGTAFFCTMSGRLGLCPQIVVMVWWVLGAVGYVGVVRSSRWWRTKRRWGFRFKIGGVVVGLDFAQGVYTPYVTTCYAVGPHT